METTFRKRLLDWYRLNQRPLPWRLTNDPYAIWISEVMLQQTRVATVVPYYERWLQRFPTAESLAAASDHDVLQCWSGLGYYSRARNLHKAAKEISGDFPSDYDSIRALTGVGEYTAGAIGSIAFGLPYAAVDGNVLRVMSRLTNEGGDIGSAVTRQRLQAAAARLLDRRHPGEFNQAMMELGATVCVPKNPHCGRCPVAESCEGRKAGRQNQLPVKAHPIGRVRVERTLLIVRRRERILFRQDRDFWELPEPEHLPLAVLDKCLGKFRHSITNRDYRFSVCEAFVKKPPSPLRWVGPSIQYLFSTTARKALHIAGLGGYLTEG